MGEMEIWWQNGGEMGENGGKWGETVLWGIAKNTLKLVGNGRKLGGNGTIWDKFPIFPGLICLIFLQPAIPSSSCDEVAS